MPLYSYYYYKPWCAMCHRMQVEVSKYTEGSKDTALRPNGLPESLIKYDGTITTSSLAYFKKKGFTLLDCENNNILCSKTEGSCP